MVDPEKVLVIVPACNEEAAISKVISSLREETLYRNLLVINDGSTDGTRAIAEGMGVAVLNLPFNLGIGAAVQSGYVYAKRKGYQYVVRIDADGQHEVEQIGKLLESLARDEADLVIGSRYVGTSSYRSSLPRRVGIHILSGIVSMIVGNKLTDPTSGFRALRRNVVSRFAARYPDDYPEVESIVCLHRMGLRIKEVGVDMSARSGGRSSITFLRSIYYMIKVLIAVGIELLRVPDRHGA